MKKYYNRIRCFFNLWGSDMGYWEGKHLRVDAKTAWDVAKSIWK